MMQRRKFRSQHLLQVVEVAMTPEFLDGHQELHGRDAQLRDEFTGFQ